MVPFSSRAGVSVYSIIYGGMEGWWTGSLSEISTTAGTSDDIPGSQPFFGHQGGFTAICCWAASSCTCTSVCVDRVISLSPHPLLCILVTLPSLLRHIVPPFMSVAATLITQRQRSYLKTQYDGATIKPSSIIARGLKCHCFINALYGSLPGFIDS